MEFFRSLLRVVGLFVPSKVDIISELPLEVSHLILRKLDPSSLQSAALVLRKWFNVCRSDKSLRWKVSTRRHMRHTGKRVKMQFPGPAATKAINQESRSRGRGEGNLRHEISLSAARTAVVT